VLLQGLLPFPVLVPQARQRLALPVRAQRPAEVAAVAGERRHPRRRQLGKATPRLQRTGSCAFAEISTLKAESLQQRVEKSPARGAQTGL
jgi:hypothetical protein